jgi:hypothetical protein
MFCAALDAERERARITKAFVGRQLGLSPATMTELFKGRIEKTPPWERVARILELCWDAVNRSRLGENEPAAIRALAAHRKEYLDSWRIRHGILEHELETARLQRPGQPSQTAPIVHRGHTLLGSMPLMCRADDSARLASWSAGPAQQNVLCLTGPGGQGKSALAWAYLTGDAAGRTVRVWHSFGDEPDPAAALTATLARAARQAFGSRDDDESAAALLLRRMATEGGLVVLDAVEHLYGPSGGVLDAVSSKFRTIADPRVEDLIRGLIAQPMAKILLTCRLAPAFVDDPVVRDQVQRLDLGPIDASASAPFWRLLKVRGTAGQLATATAALHGSPILMRLVARRVLARRDGDIGAWLTMDRAKVTKTGDSDVLRRLIPEQSMGDLAALSRQLLLLLAVSRRRLSRTDWRDIIAGRARPFSRNDRIEEPSREESETFDEAVCDLVESDLIHRDVAGDFDMHELFADAIITTAGEDELKEAYRKLRAAERNDIYMPGTGWEWSQLDSMADRAVLNNNMGLFLSLLDRGAFESASHILSNDLYPALRHRIGDLRQLRALAARYEVALARRGSADGRSGWDVELAVADGDWEEAIVLLGESDRQYLSSSNLAARAEARSSTGDFAEAYKDASAACFWAWRDSSLEEAADEYADLMDVHMSRVLWGSTLACQGFHSAVAAQLVHSKVLRAAGFRRTALLVLIRSFPLDHSRPGELSAHWEECGVLLCELGQPALARRACDIAMHHARADGSKEQLLRARTLDLELRSGAGDPLDRSELTELLAEVTQLGFGVLARRLLALHRERDSLFAAIAWQYKVEPSSHPPPPSPLTADHLVGELTILAGTRLPGQWVELELLETAVAPAKERKPISSVSLLTEAWQLTVGKTWAWQAGPWLDSWKPHASISPHFTAIHRLDLLENDRAAAQTLATTWTLSDPGPVFERLARAAFYEPTGRDDNEEVLEAMILAARACDRLSEAAWLLRYIMGAGWKPPENALRAAGLYRELRNYDQALFLSLAASEDANDRRPAGPGPASEVVRIALILGAGMDMLTMGVSPDHTVDAVQNGLSGFQMIGGPNPFSSGFRVIGADGQAPTPPYSIIGGIFGVAHQLDRDTAGFAALELFRKIAGSDRPGRNLKTPAERIFRVTIKKDPRPEATARAALALVHGHDTLISRLDQ